MSSEQEVLVLGKAGQVDPVEGLKAVLRANLDHAGLYPATPVRVGPVAGNDLAEAVVDLTGCAIDDMEVVKRLEHPATLPDGIHITTKFDTVHAKPGVLRAVSVTGAPVTLFGAEVTFDAQVENVPILWLEDHEGNLGFAVDEDRRESGLRGIGMIDVNQQEALEAIQRAADAAMAEFSGGYRVDVQQLRITQLERRSVRVEAIAKVAKGILGARATASATAMIDDSLTLHVTDVKFGSRNPVILAGLKIVQSKVEITPKDLTKIEMAGATLRDVEIVADERISIRATLG